MKVVASYILGTKDLIHHVNTSWLYTEMFTVVKLLQHSELKLIFFFFFLIFAVNIACSCNEHPKSLLKC